MTKIIGVVLLASIAICGTSLAQSVEKSGDRTEKPALSNPSDTAKSPAAPVPGKNSFTKGEAQKRLEKNGYSTVTDLTKDENSVWHANAQKGGKPVKVMVDYQGNITEQ